LTMYINRQLKLQEKYLFCKMFCFMVLTYEIFTKSDKVCP
jgi:hypothetical protein